MKKLVASLALIVFVGALTSARPLAGGSGKAIFEQYKCNKCHTIESQGIQRDGKPPEGKQPPDLSGVGLKHNPDWMQKWLLKEEEQNGKKHIKKFTGSDDELKTLTGWLGSLKKK
jgi:hypothetical protein